MVWLGWANGLSALLWDSLHKLEPKLCMRSALLSCSTIPQSHASMHKSAMRACPPEGWIMRRNTFRRAQGVKHYSCLRCKAVRDPGHQREPQEAAEVSFKVTFDSIPLYSKELLERESENHSAFDVLVQFWRTAQQRG